MNLDGLRICFVAGTLDLGGAERQLFYTLQALVASGATCRLLTLTRGEAWEEPIRNLGVGVEFVGKSGNRLSRLAAITRRLSRDVPDVIQSQHFYTNLYVVLAARALRRPGIGTLRNDCFSEVSATRWLGSASLRLPRVLVANSTIAIENAVSMGVPRARLRYLSNVVDPGIFEVRRDDVVGRRVRILAAGRLVEQKRFDRLLRVLGGLRQRGIDLEARVVGEGPLRQTLERQARELGLGPAEALFPGPAKDMREHYAWADMLVQASDHEGTPNVVLEAMASGLPVVATDAGDTRTVCPDGVTGFIVAPENEKGLLDAVAAVAADQGVRRRMGTAANSRVKELYSVDRLPTLLKKLYGSLIQRRPPSMNPVGE